VYAIRAEIIHSRDADVDADMSDGLSEYSLKSQDDPLDGRERPDVTLANGILFIRNAIWWLEVCRAVAMGDTGRVWEIMKVRRSCMRGHRAR
jgi:G:T-mismatch repair DNA endonuclease (very short patch repair protein)